MLVHRFLRRERLSSTPCCSTCYASLQQTPEAEYGKAAEYAHNPTTRALVHRLLHCEESRVAPCRQSCYATFRM